MGRVRSLSYQCLPISSKMGSKILEKVVSKAAIGSAFFWAMNLATFATVSGCTRELEGQPCPCAVGYRCCDGICLSGAGSCPKIHGNASDTASTVSVSSSIGSGGDQNASTATNSGNTAAVPGQLGSAGGASGSDAGNDSGGSNVSSGGVSGGGASGAGGSSGGDGGSGSAGSDSGGSVGTGGSGGNVDGGGAEPGTTGSGVPVLTHAYENGRSGANLAETELTPGKLLVGGFGKMASRQVSGAVHAQPLYVPDLVLGDGAVRNVVFVATARNYVFAFDADDAELGPLWVRQLGNPVRWDHPDMIETVFPQAGIIGTPVISLEHGALYVVALQNADGTPQHSLHRLELATGVDLAEPPVVSAEGFDSARAAQISALLLVDDTVYVAFGNSILDEGGRGHLLAYDAATLAGQGAISSLQGQQLGPIWMHGQGPAWDAGAIYVAADAPDTFSGPDALGSRLLRLQPASAGLGIDDWFLPSYVRDYGWTELGTSGPLPLPGTERVLVAGNRAIYLLDKNALGHHSPDDSDIVQKFVVREVGDACAEGSTCSRVFASPILWDRGDDARLYLWASNDVVRSFAFDRATGRIDCGAGDGGVCEPLALGETRAEWGTQALSFSADGAAEGTGLVWTLQRESDGARALAAVDADNLDTVWSSARDEFGPLFAWPFAAPVVTGGRVFFGTTSGLARISEGGGPALAVHVASSQLVTAWLTSPTFNLISIATSRDGQSFVEAPARLETSIVPPVLASDGAARLFLARVDAEHHIRVLTSEDATFERVRAIGAQVSVRDSQPIEAKTALRPALAFGDGRLFMAWRSEAGDAVDIASCPPDGDFDLSRATRIAVGPSNHPPALFYGSGQLQLVVPNAEAETTVFVSEDAGASFSPALTLPIDGQPAVVELDPAGSGDPDTYVFWFGDATALASELRLLTGPGCAWRATCDPAELRRDALDWSGTSVRLSVGPQPVAASVFRGSIYLGWQGSIARYTPGELVTYGLTLDVP